MFGLSADRLLPGSFLKGAICCPKFFGAAQVPTESFGLGGLGFSVSPVRAFGQVTQGLHRDLEEKLRMQAGRVVDGVCRIHLVSLVTFELVLASWVIGRGHVSKIGACLLESQQQALRHALCIIVCWWGLFV